MRFGAGGSAGDSGLKPALRSRHGIPSHASPGGRGSPRAPTARGFASTRSAPKLPRTNVWIVPSGTVISPRPSNDRPTFCTATSTLNGPPPAVAQGAYSPSFPPLALHASSTDWPSTMRPSLLCPQRP